jgi:CRISPR-associated protein Cas6
MPMIDLAFALSGATIPLDHGYALFGALSRIVPALHGERRVGVHPIAGRATAPGVLALDDRSCLRLRLPSEDLAPYLAIAGARLDLDGHALRVGVPRAEPLAPAPSVASRLVTYKHGTTGDELLADVRRDLEALGIAAAPQLVPNPREGARDPHIRRILRVKGRAIVGYALRVPGLAPEESLRLQESGLGGRRRFGCGIFVPYQEFPTR